MQSASAFLEEKQSADDFLSSKTKAEDFLSSPTPPTIKLDPYQRAYLQSGKVNPEPPAIDIPELSQQIQQNLSDVGNVARGVGTDIGSLALARPQQKTWENTWAAIQGRDELPVDADIAELAKTNPAQATAAHVAQDLMRLAPLAPALAAGGTPVMIAMGIKMLADAPDVVEKLGQELGKNKADQDPNEIARLQSQLLQTTAFTALPIAHGVGRMVGRISPAEVQGPLATGAILQTPAGAKPAAPAIEGEIEPDVTTTVTEPTPAAEPDVSPILASKTLSEVYRVGGGMMSKGKTGDELAIIQNAIKKRARQIEEAPLIANARVREIGIDPPARMFEDPQEWADLRQDVYDKDPALGKWIDENVFPNKEFDAITPEKGVPNAEAIRGNQGQLPPSGQVIEGGEKVSSNDLEQVAPEQSQPVESREGEAPVQGEIVGMGGATPSEFGPNEGADVTGVAQRVREKVAASGQEALPPPGEGIAAAESVQSGEALLAKDPNAAEAVMAKFESDPTKSVSAEGIAVARARLRQLAFEARRTEEKFGTDSPEYRAAWKARSDWAARIKPMQTEWHKSGMAQQGEQDIDTGTFTGLREAYTDATDKDFTPQQTKTAKSIAGRVKKAEGEAEGAKTALNAELEKQAGSSNAEKRALDAANKTVRENAVRLADAENKARVAQTVREREVAKVQEDAARKALEASQKTAREAATRLADAENQARVKEASARPPNDQEIATKKALDAANARVRQAAIDAAKAETDARVNPEKRVWEKVKEYLDKGEDDFDTIRSKVASDLGLSTKQVTELMTKNKRAKFLADEAWRKQEALWRYKLQAKTWLKSTQVPMYLRALATIPRAMFSLKIGGGLHGLVALGTHAPALFYMPKHWGTYFKNYGRMVRMLKSPAFFQMMRKDLLSDPNYTVARRAGLQNNPDAIEEYNIPEITGAIRSGADRISPKVAEYFNAVTGAGNRGYAVLKNLRQDIFNHHWDQLPKHKQTADMAAAIADDVNHITGITAKSAPKFTNVLLFAPRLEASRAMWLVGDPVRAADTFLRWKKSTDAEKWFAVQQVKEKAWVVGTLYGLLAINQGLLSAMGSDQEINFTDPNRSDFLKFKIAGQNIAYGGPMLAMARLPLRLWSGIKNEGKLNKIVYEDENTANTLFQYARTQLSPFAGMTADLAFGRDFQQRPLPAAGFGMLPGKTQLPKRLRAQGVEPYTWPEYITQTALPIPAAEAMHDVWREGLGMTDSQISLMDMWMPAIAKATAMGVTGARISKDWEVSQ